MAPGSGRSSTSTPEREVARWSTMTGMTDTSDVPEAIAAAPGQPVVGEPRWPMATAVVVLIGATAVRAESAVHRDRLVGRRDRSALARGAHHRRPGSDRSSLPAADRCWARCSWPSSSGRRSSGPRSSSGELVLGGPITNEPVTLLIAGAKVWLTNNIAFALLYWQFDGGGPARTSPRPAASIRTSPSRSSRTRSSRPPDWRPRVHRLPVHRVHDRQRLQPDRHAAADAMGEGGDGVPGAHLVRHRRPGDRARGQRLHVMTRE